MAYGAAARFPSGATDIRTRRVDRVRRERIVDCLNGSFDQTGTRARMGGAPRERGDYDLNPDYRPDGKLTPAAVAGAAGRTRQRHDGPANSADRSLARSCRSGEFSRRQDRSRRFRCRGCRIAGNRGGSRHCAGADRCHRTARRLHHRDRVHDHARWSVSWHPASRSSPIPSKSRDVFEVPLEFFLDPANHHRESRSGRDASVIFMSCPTKSAISGAPRRGCWSISTMRSRTERAISNRAGARSCFGSSSNILLLFLAPLAAYAVYLAIMRRRAQSQGKEQPRAGRTVRGSGWSSPAW